MEVDTPVYDCPHCEEVTAFTVLKTHVLPEEGPPEEYTLATCQKCGHPALFYREDMGGGFGDDAYYRLYPRHERHLGFALPQIVRDSYEEAVLCERARAWLACAVMVGRTLEAVTKEFDPKSKSMFKGLEKMHQSGIISDELHTWANELRHIRNLGAHPTKESVSDSVANFVG